MTQPDDRYRHIFEHTPVAQWEEDFTEVRAAFDELEASGVSDFASYFDDHPEAVLELASKVKVLDVNQYALRTLKARSKEEFYASIDKFFEADTLQVFRDQLVALSRREPYFEAEVYMRNLAGERIHCLLTLRMLDGDTRGLLTTVDITERKTIEEQLRATNRELERSNRELEQFAYVASHDLQEPLRMVASYTQLLSRRYRGQLDERADKYMGYVTDGVRRMKVLLDDLLELSRIDSKGKAFEPTDCNHVLGEVLQTLQVRLDESGARVTHDDLPTVMADRVQLSQLLQNLVANGVKFRRDEPPHVHVSASRQGPEWLVSVEDNGIGIEDEHLSTVFEMFKRVHGRGEYPGTGIGLAVAQKIVARHGGKIWVESEVGKGTTFYFTLPAMES